MQLLVRRARRTPSPWMVHAAALWLGAVSIRAEGPPTEAEEPPARFEQSLLVTTVPDLPEEVRVPIEGAGGAVPADLAAALRCEPGLDAVRRGALNLDPQVRGLQERQLAVLVDGTRTFAAGPGRMDSGMSHVGPQAAESVRVVKGPYALAWGSGALGAVRVETFRPRFGAGPGGRLALGYDDNGERAGAGATGWWSGEGVRVYGGLEVREGAAYETGDGVEVPGGYSSWEGRLGLGWQAGKSSRVEYRGSYQDQDDVSYPGRILDATYFTHRGHNLEASWVGGHGGATTEVFGRLYSNHKSHRMNNDEKPSALPDLDRMPPFGIDVDLPTESDTEGAAAHVTWAVGEVAVEGGVDALALRQDATRTIARRDTGTVLSVDRVWPDVAIDQAGAWLQAVLPRPTWTLTGTARLDVEEASAGEASPFFLDHTDGALDWDGSDVSLAASWRRRLASGWTVLAGLGRVVRYPTAVERYADRFPSTRFQVAAEFLGDPQLDPETSTQADLGLSWAGERVALQLDLFAREIDDYITVRPDPEVPPRSPSSALLVYRHVNGDAASFLGGEARLDARVGQAWSWRLSLASIRGDDETFDEPVFGLPPLLGRAGARWQGAGGLWVDGGVTVADRQDRVATSRLERPTPGYALVDLGAGWAASERWRLRVGVSNLFDEEYANHLNSLDPFTAERIPEPGRSIHVGVDLDL